MRIIVGLEPEPSRPNYIFSKEEVDLNTVLLRHVHERTCSCFSVARDFSLSFPFSPEVVVEFLIQWPAPWTISS